MNTLNAIIVDDQRYVRERINQLILENCPQVNVVDLFEQPLVDSEYLTQNQIHIIFLDVEMGEHSGFDLLRKLNDSSSLPLVIFVTAHKEYAIEAIKESAFDYLLKPVAEDELIATVNRAERQVRKIQHEKSIMRKTFDPVIQVPVSRGLSLIKTRNIIFYKASRNYTEIYLKGNFKILASKSLAYFERITKDPLFIRSHRSFLVNCREITAINSTDGGFLEMTDNLTASLTKSNRKRILEKLSWMNE